MPWDFAVILIVLAVIVPWRSRKRIIALLRSHALDSRERISLYASTIAFQWLVSLLIVWRCIAHDFDFAALGFTIPTAERAISLTVVLSTILALNQVFGVSRLARLPMGERGVIGQLAERLLPRSRPERWTAFVLVITVAICEELIYRGFIQSLFQKMLHSLLLGTLISAVFFALAHAYQGKRGIVTTFIIGTVFSAARIWTGSLFPSMIVHFVVDFSAGVAASSRLLLQRDFQ